jgi:hypothetical protein
MILIKCCVADDAGLLLLMILAWPISSLELKSPALPADSQLQRL